MTMIGALEAGGTKMRVAVFGEGLTLVREERVPTTTPDETMPAIVQFLQHHGPVDAIGVGAFGPITLNGPDRGLIGSTPKKAWIGTNLVKWLEPIAPVALDTDVGAAAVAELEHGAGQDVDSVFYVTVGTGIGGAYADRRTGVHHGHGHTEIGHVRVNRLPGDDQPSVCPYHEDCAEGLTSGPARNARPDDHRVDVVTATRHYLGQLMATIVYSFAPDRIVLGGGVMSSNDRIDLVRVGAAHALNGYSTAPSITTDDRYITPATLGQDAGLVGAALLARP